MSHIKYKYVQMLKIKKKKKVYYANINPNLPGVTPLILRKLGLKTKGIIKNNKNKNSKTYTFVRNNTVSIYRVKCDTTTKRKVYNFLSITDRIIRQKSVQRRFESHNLKI